MPVRQERKLRAIARSRGYSKKRTNRFVYGTMRRQGWRPRRSKHG